MNKSNKLRHLGGAIVALLCAGTAVTAAETVVVGPIENLAAKGSSVTVLGQTFVLSGRQSATFRSLNESGSPIGKYVLAKGEVATDGRLIAHSVALLDAPYVPGATSVFIRGAIQSYDSSIGLLKVGDVRFLVSQALADGPRSLAAGDVVEIVGTQAVASGLVWASAVSGASNEGASVQNRISVDAIVGTGKQAHAIVGTGSSAQAIVGTGKQAQAIVGTGKQVQAIVGTGKQAQAIVGTGASAQAIVGTGKQAQAIVGTGKQAQAIVGTGASAQAIVGTGKQAQAIVGTGASAQAIVGTGKRIRAIVGTGAAAQAIVGTGR